MFLSNLTTFNYQFISAGHWVVIDVKDFAFGLVTLNRSLLVHFAGKSQFWLGELKKVFSQFYFYFEMVGRTVIGLTDNVSCLIIK